MESLLFSQRIASHKLNVRVRHLLRRCSFLFAGLMVAVWAIALPAEPIAVRHVQRPMRRSMVARSEDGRTIANGEFSQVVQGDEVTMRLTYRFVDGSLDDEETTFTQRGTLRLVRSRHIQKGPFFTKPIDFTVEAATGTATSRTTDKNGNIHLESKHVDLPNDLANGFVGTVLLNVPHDTKPFRVRMLAPVGGGRLVPLVISPQSEQTVYLEGQAIKATVFRIHPELSGIVRVIARLIGLQPKDVSVWVLEGDDPAIAVMVGQLGGYGPVVSSDLVGTSLGK
ncbi:hypothetical protein SAMN05421770_102437 [Granulicella rosea]|uniref:Uncharacterized protein n=1 Tax=Granulicella rosea TaxID=474952 RepID=A0A239HKF2_9BACT|nr:hypothetical protein [Granulicella rosea]SNS81792.1 hypothetical protein SAMN05421770_102437 [Granulicella rosea]